MDHSPAVSVVMPVYNAERYLRVAVESILNQTFTDFEFIIIDDGSTDGSLKILREYADKDSRIRLISRENRGRAVSRNEGASLVQAPYVAIMDADDISLPERLARQYAYMSQHPECVAMGTGFGLIDGEGRHITRLPLRATDNEAIQRYLLEGQCVVQHPTALVRREAFELAGGYREEYAVGQDYDLWLRIGEVGEIHNVDEVLLYYREHEASAGSQRTAEERANAIKACQEAWERRGVVGQYELNMIEHRPANTRKGRSDYLSKLGWWAYRSGNYRTALVYGRRSLFENPLSVNPWKLMMCALFKREPDSVEQ